MYAGIGSPCSRFIWKIRLARYLPASVIGWAPSFSFRNPRKYSTPSVLSRRSRRAVLAACLARP
eukprot:5031326-Lingulodinium_polyedra.AAC.1